MWLCQCFPHFWWWRRFPLLDLPVHLQEKIISKLNQKSYFRLQRTCKYIQNLIENSHHITVYVEIPKWPKYDAHLTLNNNQILLSIQKMYGVRREEKTFYFLPYGVRFNNLHLPDFHEYFETFCDILKKHRITTYGIFSHENYWIKTRDRLELEHDVMVEQWIKILRILKPKNIGSDDFFTYIPHEALFQFNEFNTINSFVRFDAAEAVPVITKFLSFATSLELHLMTDWSKLIEGEAYNFLVTMIEMVHSNKFPKLLNFLIYFNNISTTEPTEESMAEIFRDFNPIISTISYRSSIKLDLQCFRYNNHLCQIDLDRSYGHIEYHWDGSYIHPGILLYRNRPCPFILDRFFI